MSASISASISLDADKKCKYVVVSGGVISGIGKGLAASSIGVLLKSCGWRVTAIKIDPYINIDAGTMSPIEHGEVFVLDDGGEADLDLGNYERFLGCTLQRDNNITTGKIYSQVIERERRGDYLGKTVQVVPHVTDAIQAWIHRVANLPGPDGLSPEICVIELGGTVGDIESMPYVEALRQLRYNIGDINFCSVFVSLVPELGPVGEQKTKPTQHGVKNLSSMGLSPQLIVCRSERPLLPETKRKIGLFCQVDPSAVVSVHDVSNTYKIPIMLQEQGVCNLLIRSLQLVWRLPTLLEKWALMAHSGEESAEEVTIAVIGKYTVLSDAYLSVDRALQHAGMAARRRVHIQFVESSDLEEPSPSPRVSAANLNGGSVWSVGEWRPEGKPSKRCCVALRGCVGRYARCRRDSGAGWVWAARIGGDDPGCGLRAGIEEAVPRDLPRYAGGGHPGGADGVQGAAGQLGGNGREYAAASGRVYAGGRQDQDGRDHAARLAHDQARHRRLPLCVAVRVDDHRRAAPPPVRGKPGAGGEAGHGRRAAVCRDGRDRAADGDCGGA
jgi:CTP synthase N-terminus